MPFKSFFFFVCTLREGLAQPSNTLKALLLLRGVAQRSQHKDALPTVSWAFLNRNVTIKCSTCPWIAPQMISAGHLRRTGAEYGQRGLFVAHTGKQLALSGGTQPQKRGTNAFQIYRTSQEPLLPESSLLENECWKMDALQAREDKQHICIFSPKIIRGT